MPYCDRCDRSYRSWRALNDHKRDSDSHWECDDCNLDFESWSGLKQHYIQSPRHAYCQHCDEHFDDDEDLEEHFESDHDYCGKCGRVFKNERGLHEHLRQSSDHHYCSECKRDFNSENSLRNHLNSSVHRPKDVRCPFKGCGKAFVSRAAMVLHLEAGACASGVNRTTINNYVRKFDKSNIITGPSHLITGPAGYDSDDDVAYIATPRAWNGHAFECYLCDREFSKLNALNQHLASPRHADKIYICRGKQCGDHFSTLSALVQHIESEKCGVVRFKAVQQTMDNILGHMKRLTM